MPSFVVHRIAKLLDMQAQELVSWIEEAKLVLHLEFREEAAGAMLGELRLNPKKAIEKGIFRRIQTNTKRQEERIKINQANCSDELRTTRGANQNKPHKLYI